MFTRSEAIPLECIWGALEETISNIKGLFQDGHSGDWTFKKCSINPLDLCSPAPQKGGAHPARFALWRPLNVPFGCAMVSNYESGEIQLMRHLNRFCHQKHFHTVLARDHRDFGYCNFLYVEENGRERAVHVLRDTRWEYFEQGAVQSFEKPKHYRARRIADRLTPHIVITYLKTLGWDLEAPEFWLPNGDVWLGCEQFK